MKALKHIPSISLGAFLIMMVLLWPTSQRRPSTYGPYDPDLRPQPLLNLDDNAVSATLGRRTGPDRPAFGSAALPSPFRVGFSGTGDSKPLPPNPHAAPPWQERVPHVNKQIEHGLFVTPVLRDREH